MKWKESGFRPHLCTYRLNWARRASWGWWDDWNDTVLQTQDSKFEPWRSEAEHATSRSRRLPTILTIKVVRARRFADVAACRAVSNPAWCRIFREISWVSLLNIGTLLRCWMCPWARPFTLKCFTWLRWKWVSGRTEMAMCTKSSGRRHGCRTVCSPGSWNSTRINRSSDQGV